jgi:hypothetical protein
LPRRGHRPVRQPARCLRHIGQTRPER